MKQATFVFTCDSVKDAEILEQSLFPEVRQKIPKSAIQLIRCKKNLTLTIESSDTSSLRAACNSYLRWIQTALNVKSIV